MNNEKNILEFENLYYEVKNKDEKIDANYARIINGLSGTIESGKITAVMGSSGCGKTHFFDLIIGTIESNAKTSGTILYNGKPRVWEEWTKKIAFLPQDDIYFPDLTIMESIMHSLSFDTTKDYKEKQAIATEALKASMIYDKRNALVKTLSGGERKRAMIAMTLINQPEILILDEPTTGLDSNSALKIVLSLKKYAEENNRIVIVTVHQPGEGLFNLFGDLIFLTRGGLFYMGPVSKVKDFLIQNGIEISDQVSLAEFLFLLHVGESNEFINTQKYKDVIRDCVHRNAASDSEEVEVSKCNNNSVFRNSFNIKHSLLLLKHNIKLMYKSDSFTSNMIFFLVTSGLFYLVSYFYTANRLNQVCNDTRFERDLIEATFTDKLSLAYEIFYDFFSSQVVYYGIYFSFDKTESRMFDLEIFSGKFSGLSYMMYQFIEKSLISMIFLTVDFFLNAYILKDSGIPISVWFMIYYIILISVLLFTISYLMVSNLPLGPKMNNFLLFVINYYFFWFSPESKWVFKDLLNKAVGDYVIQMFNIQFIFPHVNYNSMLGVQSTMIQKELLNRSLGGLDRVFRIFKEINFVRAGAIVQVSNVLEEKYTDNPEFAYQVFDLPVTNNMMIFILPLSIGFTITVAILLFRFCKLPNVRTNLKIN